MEAEAEAAVPPAVAPAEAAEAVEFPSKGSAAAPMAAEVGAPETPAGKGAPPVAAAGGND